MRLRPTQVLLTTAFIGTLSIAAAQGLAACYTPIPDPPTQSGLSCDLYTVCPGRTLCGFGGNGLPGTIVMVTLNCKNYSGGTGTIPNCTGGTFVIGVTKTVTVAEQDCPVGQCSTPGGGSGIE